MPIESIKGGDEPTLQEKLDMRITKKIVEVNKHMPENMKLTVQDVLQRFKHENRIARALEGDESVINKAIIEILNERLKNESIEDQDRIIIKNIKEGLESNLDTSK